MCAIKNLMAFEEMNQEKSNDQLYPNKANGKENTAHQNVERVANPWLLPL